MKTKAEIHSPAIIRDVSLLGQRLPRDLPGQVREKIVSTCENLRQKSYREYGSRLVTTFSCYLAVTGDAISDHLPHHKNSVVWLRLIGALNSATFVELPAQTRYLYSRVAIEVGRELWPEEGAFHNITISSLAPTPSIKALVKKFEAIKLNDEQVLLWRGWPLEDAGGHIRWLPLHSVAIRHGMPFASKLYEIIANYWSGSRRQKIGALALFIEALATFPDLTTECLRNRETVRLFWQKFWDFYTEKRSETCRQTTVINDWTREWTQFVRAVLEGSGLFAYCVGQFPGPDSDSDNRNPKSLENLLCALPTERLSDEEALKFLSIKIPEALECVKAWAQKKTSEIMGRRRSRKRAALTGQIRVLGNSRKLVSRDNPDHYANACATFEHHGFLTRNEMKSLFVLYPADLGLVAEELGLPTTTSLLPHAALLVAEHSELTPSMLENLELWNERGKLTGLSRQQQGLYYLRAPKFRSGKRTGYKTILLNRRSLRIIREILVLTREIRDYLRVRHRPDWRKLFITCGEAFSPPTAVGRFSTLTSSGEYTAKLVQEFSKTLRIPTASAAEFVRRFSLRSVRSTKALCVFLNTHSEAEMAKALGQTGVRNDVLERYLPQLSGCSSASDGFEYFTHIKSYRQ
ncbi:hypothetical protein B0G80_3691 [Paraburkholderia sp. BL6669N2]|uniref:hypothetical protein n=1 Tax=Paraburkholderia sp. BL6669N2 TaxID=1938807 RepID=UPI000E252431|nr:hypothetical protein [Paraburkholderia sp. BL6669N2]REG60867.1 hypothetical protein B0G80_3691 [Paraburkholderia sp. BL6669N2]